MYIDPLLNKLNNSQQGCYIGHLAANAFGYADDIVLLSPSCTALKNLILICEKFAVEYKLNFNPQKCKILVYSIMNIDPDDINITIGGHKMEVVDSEKHLGHSFQTKDYMINIENIIKDIRIRSNVIINNFRPISWQAKVTLFLSQCSSLYGCQIWNLEDPMVNKLVTTWKVCNRNILNVDPKTRSFLLPQIMDTLPLKDVIMSRSLNFFIGGLTHDSKVISDFFKNTLLSSTSFMLTNINTIINKYKFDYQDIFNLNKAKVKSVIKNYNDEQGWRSNIIKKLLSIRENPWSSNLDPNEVKDHLLNICIYREE